MPLDIVFALPDNDREVSGGNIYNAGLLLALGSRASARGIEAVCANVAAGQPGIYCIDSLNLDEFARLSAPRREQRFVLVVHHLRSFEPDHDSHDPDVSLERATLGRFDALLATSSFTVERLVTLGVAETRIFSVTPAIDLDPGEPRPFGLPLSIVVVANLVARKAVREFLEVLEARLDASDKLRIEIVGRSDIEPQYAGKCRELIDKSSRLGRVVTLRGALPHHEMAELYQAAHILLSTSKMETFGMALQEARAQGLLILARDAGYVRHHFTDGDTGLLFTSLEALADGLLGLVRDEARARRLCEYAARTRPRQDYTWSDAARLFMEGLHRCMPDAFAVTSGTL